MKNIFYETINYKKNINIDYLKNIIINKMKENKFFNNPYSYDNEYYYYIKKSKIFIRKKLELNNFIFNMLIIISNNNSECIKMTFITNPLIWIFPLWSLFISIYYLYYSIFYGFNDIISYLAIPMFLLISYLIFYIFSKFTSKIIKNEYDKITDILKE